MLTSLPRRAFLAGLFTLLAEPIYPLAKGMPGRVAHIVTAFDDSSSMYSKGGIRHISLNMPRIPHLQDWALAMENYMEKIIEDSSFEEIIFEAFGWSQASRAMVMRIVLRKGDCRTALASIAQQLRDETHNPMLLLAGILGGTDINVAFREGLSRFDIPADHRVLNIVSDDDSSRISAFGFRMLRDEAIRRAITVNALVLGDPNAMDGYFKTVATGKVIQGVGPLAWKEKFETDLLM